MPTVASANVPMPGMAKSQPSRAEAGGAAIAKDGEPSPRAVATSIYADKHSFDYVWRSGLAGGMAGCVAKTVVAPLDRVKILFQASNPQFAKYSGSWFGVVTAMRDIYRQDGLRGLYRGHSATLLRIFPYASIKFLAYEQIRGVVIRGPEHETPLRRLVAGSLAGVTSVLFTYPLELVRVRLAFETRADDRSSLRDICRRIYHEHPVTKAPAAAASDAARRVGAVVPPGLRHAAAEAAGAVASVAPRSGLVNFYRGFSSTVLGMLPYAGMSFLTHDTLGDVLRRPELAEWTVMPAAADGSYDDDDAAAGGASLDGGRPRRKDKPPQLVFWAELAAGGLAGMVSQTASYPLEVIRRRMQVGGAVGDGHRLRIAETAALIWRERGFGGFFVGLTIGYVKVVPMVAVSFYTYERMKEYLGI